mmetsp:Transcript_25423/g.62561  ORF Transcript_25423/g.62561 Transcript_25423/m.62561 type:complete len:153 (+) Transcript_25423:84-542(+)
MTGAGTNGGLIQVRLKNFQTKMIHEECYHNWLKEWRGSNRKDHNSIMLKKGEEVGWTTTLNLKTDLPSDYNSIAEQTDLFHTVNRYQRLGLKVCKSQILNSMRLIVRVHIPAHQAEMVLLAQLGNSTMSTLGYQLTRLRGERLQNRLLMLQI